MKRAYRNEWQPKWAKCLQDAMNMFCADSIQAMGGGEKGRMKLTRTLMCVMYAESGWSEKAGGPAGDTGLFQIVPDYHCGYKKKPGNKEDFCEYWWQQAGATYNYCLIGQCAENLKDGCCNIICGVALFCHTHRKKGFDLCKVKTLYKTINDKKFACCACYFAKAVKQ